MYIKYSVSLGAPRVHTYHQRKDTGRGAWGTAGGRGAVASGAAGPHLLALLDAQLTPNLDAFHGVGEEVVGGVLHVVLVEGACEVPAQEDHRSGQQLQVGHRGLGLRPGPCPQDTGPLGGLGFSESS